MKPGSLCPKCLDELWPAGDGVRCRFCGFVWRPKEKPAAAPAEPFVVAGLDLGKLRDFTAFIPVRVESRAEGQHFGVLDIHRFELGTSYPKMVKDVVGRMSRDAHAKARLAIDQTGVGAAVVDMFRAEESLAGRVVPVQITGGTAVSWQRGAWHVAKVELVSALQRVVSGRRWSVPRNLPLAPALAAEMKKFSEKVTKAGNQGFEAWRESDHDDLVLALALAVWVAENTQAAKVLTVTGPEPGGKKPLLSGWPEVLARGEVGPGGAT